MSRTNFKYRQPAVYILSNKNRKLLYIGVTSRLKDRIEEHKIGRGSDYTKKYKIQSLVYYEYHQRMQDALEREKQLKNWRRAWKWELIKSQNPDLIDLYHTLV